MSDEVSQSDLVNKVVPGVEGFKDLAFMGMKMGLGGAVSGIAGSLIASRFASPVPVISSRTLGSAATTVGLYAAYRMIKQEQIKDIAKYAAAGSAAFTAGSLVVDMTQAFNIKLPGFVNMALGAASGASGQAQDSGADVDTAFQ